MNATIEKTKKTANKKEALRLVDAADTPLSQQVFMFTSRNRPVESASAATGQQNKFGERF
ncbi:MAG: hypothetical protein LBU12_01275 [Deltaproteobacteria bacterium]|jgi:hypothetical protein|nr:hypothetical protein [Deltaproteobacteria bacterium]